jgi:hypothetical protein
MSCIVADSLRDSKFQGYLAFTDPLVQHAYAERLKVSWTEAKALQTEPNAHTGNARRQPTWFWRIVLSVSPAATSVGRALLMLVPDIEHLCL